MPVEFTTLKERIDAIYQFLETQDLEYGRFTTNEADFNKVVKLFLQTTDDNVARDILYSAFNLELNPELVSKATSTKNLMPEKELDNVADALTKQYRKCRKIDRRNRKLLEKAIEKGGEFDKDYVAQGTTGSLSSKSSKTKKHEYLYRNKFKSKKREILKKMILRQLHKDINYTPHQRLEANQEHVLDLAKQAALISPQFIPKSSIKRKESAVSKLLQAQNDYDQPQISETTKFTLAIELLQELRDNKSGIVWHRCEGRLREDGSPDLQVVIRDSRNAVDPIPNTPEGWVIQNLNYIRSSFTILDHAVKRGEIEEEAAKNAKVKLEEAAERFYSYIMTHPERDYIKVEKEGLKEIVDILKEAGIEDAPVAIQNTKDWSNFLDKHKHMATITNYQGDDGRLHAVVEAEVAMLGLTKEQQDEYRKIASLADGQEAGIYWFDRMIKPDKQLVKEYASFIASENYVIPTQLATKVSALKNAYRKVTAVVEGDKLEIVHETMHSGTVASLQKIQTGEDREKYEQELVRIAKQNAVQAASFVAKDERVHIATLNSPSDITPANRENEERIVTQSRIAADHVGGEYSNSPLNNFRRLNFSFLGEGFGSNGNYTEGQNNILSEMAKIVEQGVEDLAMVADYIRDGNNEDAALRKFAEYRETHPAQKRLMDVIEQAIKARKIIEGRVPFFGDPDNNNLQLSSYIDLIGHSLYSDGQGKYRREGHCIN